MVANDKGRLSEPGLARAMRATSRLAPASERGI